VEAVSKAGGPKLDRRLIQLAHPIKSLGQHQVTVKVHPEVEATLTVEVVKG
jgi:large subunit ribosomal protein L9